MKTDYKGDEWKYNVDSFFRLCEIYKISLYNKERIWEWLLRIHARYPRYLTMPERLH